MWGGMEQSPGSRDIEKVTGEPDTIIARGREIRILGAQMTTSATELEDIATGTTELRGKAVDKLKEIVGEAYIELRNAGQMYTPTGPVVYEYGVALADVKPKINAHVDMCESLWSTYESLPGDRHGRGTGGWFEPEAGSAEADQQKEEDDAKQAAWEDWRDEALRFDDDYEDWEAAFELAADRVGTILDGSIQDSAWDIVDGIVADVLFVLQWVGIALAIVGFIIGGPFIAALAAIVAIATLVLTVYQFLRDDAGLTDVIFAVVGVIPFGSIGKASFVSDMLGGFPKGGLSGFASSAGDFASSFGAFSRGWSRGLSQGGSLFSNLNRGVAGMQGAAGRMGTGGILNTIVRVSTGQNASDLMESFGPGGMIDLWKHKVGTIDMVLGPLTGNTISGGLPSWSFDQAVLGDVPEPIDPPVLPWEQ